MARTSSMHRINMLLGGGGSSNLEAPLLIFDQTTGPELLTDPGFDAWTGAGNLTHWTETANAPFSEVNQRSSTQGYAGTGTGSVNLYTPAFQAYITQDVLTVDDFYQCEMTVSYYDVTSQGAIMIAGSAGNTSRRTHFATGTFRGILRATQVGFTLEATSETSDITFSNASVKRITPIASGTGVVSGTTTLTFNDLPASPVIGDAIELRYRWIDHANHWVMELVRDTSRWNVNLYSVVNNVRTLRRGPITNVTNLGPVDAIRVTVNSSSSHQMYTGVAGTFTARGMALTNTTHNTADGLHVIYTSGFVPDGSWTITAE